MCEISRNNTSNLIDPKYNSLRISPAPQGRILYDIPCKVCRDHSSGKHYGIYACDGCAGFFKRSVRRGRQYACKSQKQGYCTMDKTHRNQCRACRLRKCLEAGMNRDAVQHERGPRNSTLRRHMAIYKDAFLNNEFQHISQEVLMNTAALAGFPGVPMPIPRQNSATTNNHQFPSVILPHATTPIILDLSVPRAPSHQHFCHQPPHAVFFPPSATYMPSEAVPPTPQTPQTPPAPPVPPAPPAQAAPPILTALDIRESAAEHLLRNIQWIKSLSIFRELPINDQHFLLEESWKELFILSISHHFLPITISQLLIDYQMQKSNRDVFPRITKEIYALQDVLFRLRGLFLDLTEYEFLRLNILFRKPISKGNDDLANTSISTGSSSPISSTSTESRGLPTSPKIAALHDDSRDALKSYIERVHPNFPIRFYGIFEIMSLMKNISCFAIEEVFFRKDIGQTTIVSIISKVYETQHF